MLKRKEMIAMLLAGGQGSRLGVLTTNLAKPAVPFGGKYRIIDFPLSNCVNSGIDTVGVLTQYQPLELNEYIGNGQPWGLDRNNGGVHILQPYAQSSGANWYTNTANAIYQNIHFIKQYHPEYVAILSGDHIYKMNYDTMLTYHKETNADCTIAVLDVSLEEATRFGIMNTNPDKTIYEFEEKPKHPKSTKASMGIYIFTWSVLEKFLTEDAMDETSSHDFGKNIIPNMLADGRKLMAYEFDGYWKDVGTIDSLWEANMDLLNPHIPMDLNDKKFKIYARNYNSPPTFVGTGASIKSSFITKGCDIQGTIDQSVIFSDCIIEKGAIVRDSIIMPGVIIKSGAVIDYAIIGTDSVVNENAVIGGRPEDYEDKDKWGVTVVGYKNDIKADTVIHPKAMI